jgi:hypothetical protein
MLSPPPPFRLDHGLADLGERYRDNSLGLVDATVIAAAEMLDEPKLATLDHRHFGAVRPCHCEALQLLPE